MVCASSLVIFDGCREFGSGYRLSASHGEIAKSYLLDPAVVDKDRCKPCGHSVCWVRYPFGSASSISGFTVGPPTHTVKVGSRICTRCGSDIPIRVRNKAPEIKALRSSLGYFPLALSNVPIRIGPSRDLWTREVTMLRCVRCLAMLALRCAPSSRVHR